MLYNRRYKFFCVENFELSRKNLSYKLGDGEHINDKYFKCSFSQLYLKFVNILYYNDVSCNELNANMLQNELNSLTQIQKSKILPLIDFNKFEDSKDIEEKHNNDFENIDKFMNFYGAPISHSNNLFNYKENNFSTQTVEWSFRFLQKKCKFKLKIGNTFNPLMKSLLMGNIKVDFEKGIFYYKDKPDSWFYYDEFKRSFVRNNTL